MNLKDYEEFVEQVTSLESNKTMVLKHTMEELEKESGVNIALLLTGAIGIASEGGEFGEIVKKWIFQGKPMDAETRFHAKRELGDILWYWINSCRALDLDPNEVIKENVFKLESRYPGGKFDTYFSENRKQGDL